MVISQSGQGLIQFPAIIAVLVSVSPLLLLGFQQTVCTRRFSHYDTACISQVEAEAYNKIFGNIRAIPLAATASVPRCPMITEYMENLFPMQDYWISNGTMFSARNGHINFFLTASETEFHSSDPATIHNQHSRNCTTVGVRFASAAPLIPIFGKPDRLKMKTAFNAILRITITPIDQGTHIYCTTVLHDCQENLCNSEKHIGNADDS